MIHKTTRLLILLTMCVAVSVCGTAQAKSVQDAILDAFAGPTTPIVLEDDDFNILVIDHDGDGYATQPGEGVYGYIRFQHSRTSNLTVPPVSIVDATKDFNTATGTPFGDGVVDEFFAVFGLEIIGFGPDPLNPLGPGGAFLGPLALRTVVAVDPITGLNVTWGSLDPSGGAIAGRMFDLYADPAGGFGLMLDSTNPVTAFATAFDGSEVWLDTVGFTVAPVAGVNAAGEWYINIDMPGTTPVPEQFNLSLNFLGVGPSPKLGLPVFASDLGTDVFGYGSLVDTSAGAWLATSDGNFGIMVPIPAAAYSGMMLLGALGAIRFVRRRRHASRDE